MGPAPPAFMMLSWRSQVEDQLVKQELQGLLFPGLSSLQTPLVTTISRKHSVSSRTPGSNGRKCQGRPIELLPSAGVVVEQGGAKEVAEGNLLHVMTPGLYR